MDETNQIIERSKKVCKTLHTFVQIAQPFLLQRWIGCSEYHNHLYWNSC
jgi:hypothetical protein